MLPRRFLYAVLLALILPLQAWADTAEVWVDVRSAGEYNSGHIAGHANIPHTEIAQRISELTDDKNAPIRLYCRSGRRSGMAEAELAAMGYTDVQNLGGYEEVKANLELVAAECRKDPASC
jgi:phage shock protein E